MFSVSTERKQEPILMFYYMETAPMRVQKNELHKIKVNKCQKRTNQN